MDPELSNIIDEATSEPQLENVTDMRTQIERVIYLNQTIGGKCIFQYSPKEYIAVCSVSSETEISCPYIVKNGHHYFAGPLKLNYCDYQQDHESNQKKLSEVLARGN